MGRKLGGGRLIAASRRLQKRGEGTRRFQAGLSDTPMVAGSSIRGKDKGRVPGVKMWQKGGLFLFSKRKIALVRRVGPKVDERCFAKLGKFEKGNPLLQNEDRIHGSRRGAPKEKPKELRKSLRWSGNHEPDLSLSVAKICRSPNL